MTFKYGLAVPITGPHKIKRFKAWMKEVLPDLDYSLPIQVPIDTASMTVRLKSPADKERIQAALPPLVP